MKIKYLIGITICLFILPQISLGQYFFRLKADVSIKEVSIDQEHRLVVGQVYYDIHHKKIVYDITFPEKERWVLQDTTYYLFKDDVLVERSLSLIFPEFSVFHLALEGHLDDYGLQDHPIIKVKDIEKTDDGVIRTLRPIAGYEENLGPIKILTSDRKLKAVLFYNVSERLMSRQFFEDYTIIKGVEVPRKIVQFLYPNPDFHDSDDKGYTLIQTTLSNIQINRTDEEYMYNFPVPD